MKSGYVMGVIHKPDCVRMTVYADGKETTVKVCLSDKAKAIRVGDFVWTQCGCAMWTSQELGVQDVELPIHRTLWNGTHPCCNHSHLTEKLPK